MQIIVASPHFTVSIGLNEYVIQKVKKLEHLNQRLIRCDVFLKLDKSGTDDNKVCEIKVSGSGKSIFAGSRGLTFEDSITQTVHAVEKQLRKQKTKCEKVHE